MAADCRIINQNSASQRIKNFLNCKRVVQEIERSYHMVTNVVL